MKCVKFWLSSLCFLGFVSCVHIKPVEAKTETVVEIVDTVPSWDGNEQNSGILDFIPGKGWLLTNKAAIRYMILSEKYGNMFVPALEKGEGLAQEGANFILPQEYMVKFAVMNRENKKPK